MSIPAIVWLAVAAASALLAVIFLAAFVRQAIVVGRAIARFADEAGAARPTGTIDRTR